MANVRGGVIDLCQVAAGRLGVHQALDLRNGRESGFDGRFSGGPPSRPSPRWQRKFRVRFESRLTVLTEALRMIRICIIVKASRGPDPVFSPPLELPALVIPPAQVAVAADYLSVDAAQRGLVRGRRIVR